MEWSRGVPIYIVALARPELLETRPDWGAGKRNFTSLALEPLTAAAMHELLAGLVPGLPDDATARIVARADGVPLYAVEIVRMLVAQGSLEAGDGAYRPVGDLADLAVPDTLHSLIAARLDALEPADRAMIQAAAVLGQSFTVDGLAAVAVLDAEEVERRLLVLARRELVARDMDPRSTERGQFVFVQSLVREVAVLDARPARPQSRHLAAARHFETLVDQELAGRWRAHYLAAYRNATEGPEADALAAQARIALRAAGDRAVALGAQEQALGFYPRRAGRDERAVGTSGPAGAVRPGRVGGRAARGSRAAARRGDRPPARCRRPQRGGTGHGAPRRRDVRPVSPRRRPRPGRAGGGRVRRPGRRSRAGDAAGPARPLPDAAPGRLRGRRSRTPTGPSRSPSASTESTWSPTRS